MSFTRYFRRALALSMAVVAFAASAQIVLFDAPDLQGGKLTIRGDEPNLADSDFNDRAQSILVQGGLWEVCVDADFRGDCTRLQAGEYRVLDRRFVKSISSLRPIGAVGAVYPGQGAQPQAPTAVIVMPQVASSCMAGATEACSACRVSCTGGQQAVCKEGTEYPKLIGKPAECAFPSQCACH